MGRKKPESLTVQEARAITLLVSGYSSRDVAIKLDVTPECVSLWHKNDRFKTAKKQALDTLYNAAMAEMIDGMQLACRELIKIIEDQDTPHRVKIQAINVLLTHVSKNKNQNSVSDVLELDNNTVSIDSLVRTATNREELVEALELKFKYENWQYNRANKMTETAYKEGIESIVKVLTKKLDEETLKEVMADILGQTTSNTDSEITIS